MTGEIDLDEALRIYLGDSGAGDYDPSGGDARLQSAFGAEWEPVRARAKECLSVLDSFQPGATESLAQGARRVERALAERLPQLRPTTRRAMANCWAYSWR